MPSLLGYTRLGDGPAPVLVLHDWFCDHSAWDPALPYLSTDRFTYAFADLRGYGKSRDIEGTCTLEEAAADTVALADHLGWTRFSIIGHSMSGLVVQRCIQLIPDRITRLVAITPAPPAGMQLDSGMVEFFRSLALADDARRFSILKQLWGDRLSEQWIRYKLQRWRQTANPAAVAKYVEMWGSTDISQSARGLRTPMLILACAHDAPPFQQAALEASMLPYYPNARVALLDGSGHYPMQEQPPLLVAEIERFLSE